MVVKYSTANKSGNIFSNVYNKAKSFLLNSKPEKHEYDLLPPDYYKNIIKHPWALRKIVNVSIEQDWEGSHYQGILNTIAQDCTGPCPRIIGQTSDYTVNDEVEQKWLLYCQLNSIGSEVRLLRRSAAKTGIGIAIPIISENLTGDRVPLRYKVISSQRLKSPPMSSMEDRIFDGIEYDKNWDPIKIYLDTDESYEVKDIILWWKRKNEELHVGVPECGAAMCIFPSVRRYLNALVRSAEFRSCIPMVVKLDPQVWGREHMPTNMQSQAPKGLWEMEPGMIPTLPPGTTLEGLSHTGTSADDLASIDAMVGAAARCVNMPINLATGNSSKHNMASSQVDLGPWKNTVKSDREDFAPVVHNIFQRWLKMAVRTEGYFSSKTRRIVRNGHFYYSIGYSQLFSHPDPNKVSSSRFTELICGANTLTRIYSDEGLNARRELQREADLLGVTYEEYCNVILSARSTSAIKIVHNEKEDEESSDQEQFNKNKE